MTRASDSTLGRGTFTAVSPPPAGSPGAALHAHLCPVCVEVVPPGPRYRFLGREVHVECFSAFYLQHVAACEALVARNAAAAAAKSR
jgi:hypothetical protein